MAYRKITLDVVVEDDDSEVLVQALNNSMDCVGEHVTVFWSEIRERETETPENATEIASVVN